MCVCARTRATETERVEEGKRERERQRDRETERQRESKRVWRYMSMSPRQFWGHGSHAGYLHTVVCR